MILQDAMRSWIALAAIGIAIPARAFGQSQPCDARSNSKDCAAIWAKTVSASRNQGLAQHLLTERDNLAQQFSQEASRSTAGNFNSDRAVPEPEEQGFHWRRALAESFTFLAIEQAYVIHTDFRWVVSQNGIPFNHYWRDYTQSLSQWIHSGWNDGDPNWFGYVGHPIQGALTGFIQIQNDPKGEKQVFSKTKPYWKSRLKAALWNTVYSLQWNLGPLSEPTVEKYGAKDRAPWNPDGSYPCTSKNCYTGVGQIDIVMTPLGGTGWMIGEDFLDEKVVRRLEDGTHSRLLVDTIRVALNPLRGGANILHGKHPWYRASRDEPGTTGFAEQKSAVSTSEVSSRDTSKLPNHGNIFVGYTHTGGSYCETVAFGTRTVCDPLSSKSSKLGGWDVGLEKIYFRYFGVIADFSGQYGGVRQNNFLFGLRGGAGIGRVHPFAQALIGAVRVREGSSTAPITTFAEDLGLGIDLQLVRLLSWRNQVDELKTGSPDFERRNLRLSSGFAWRF